MELLMPDAAVSFDDPRDFLIGDFWELAEKIKEAPRADRKLIALDQYKHKDTRHFCTVVACLSIIASIYNQSFSEDDILECFKYAKIHGNPKYEAGKGNLSANGANIARKRWNIKFPEKQVVQFRGHINSREMQILLDKNYGVARTYKGNANYNKDMLDNSILEWVDFPNSTYGHMDSLYRREWTKDYMILNNYRERYGDKNQYKIPFDNLSKLVRNGVIYPNVYVFLPLNEISKKLDVRQIKILNAQLKINSLTRNTFDGNKDFFELQNKLNTCSNEVRRLKNLYLVD